METQEIINEILAYHQELNDNYVECRDAFGSLDPDTQRAFKELITIEELINRLKINK
jgi:hypothetical protein